MEKLEGLKKWLLIVLLVLWLGGCLWFLKDDNSAMKEIALVILGIIQGYFMGRFAGAMPGNGKKEEAKEVKPSG